MAQQTPSTHAPVWHCVPAVQGVPVDKRTSTKYAAPEFVPRSSRKGAPTTRETPERPTLSPYLSPATASVAVVSFSSTQLAPDAR